MNRALALIGTMAIAAATLAACGGGGDDNDAGSSADTFGNRSSEALRDGTKGAATPVVDQASARASTTTAGGGQPAAQVGELDRKVIITAAISLTVDDLAGTFAEASNIARSAGGFVEESNFSQAVDDSGERKAPQTATLRLRVPASEHGAVVDSLRRMAGVKVAREGQRSQEVTEQYT
ncbi:MAG: DUF4349 domain-containing protein, partial [SAR202 cluster bacterium]|nr:DUF4349 domain-containing protein [SAR202 cluster bacterium]